MIPMRSAGLGCLSRQVKPRSGGSISFNLHLFGQRLPAVKKGS